MSVAVTCSRCEEAGRDGPWPRIYKTFANRAYCVCGNAYAIHAQEESLWGAWVVITLPIAALNVILYCLDIVEVY